MSFYHLLVCSTLAACAACQSCPDLQQVSYRLEAHDAEDRLITDPAISMDIEQVDAEGNTVKVVATDWRPTEGTLADVPAGRYRFIGQADGVEFGRVENVCTLGELKGCEAEDAPDNSFPLLIIRQDAEGTRTLTLERNGKCP